MCKDPCAELNGSSELYVNVPDPVALWPFPLLSVNNAPRVVPWKINNTVSGKSVN
jgi:hypothetical protein